MKQQQQEQEQQEQEEHERYLELRVEGGVGVDVLHLVDGVRGEDVGGGLADDPGAGVVAGDHADGQGEEAEAVEQVQSLAW